MQGPRLPSFTEALHAVKQALGPLARVWREPGKVSIGLEQNPGRLVLARGPNLHVAMVELLGTLAQEQGSP